MRLKKKWLKEMRPICIGLLDNNGLSKVRILEDIFCVLYVNKGDEAKVISHKEISLKELR
jgi:hypothetical protein